MNRVAYFELTETIWVTFLISANLDMQTPNLPEMGLQALLELLVCTSSRKAVYTTIVRLLCAILNCMDERHTLLQKHRQTGDHGGPSPPPRE